MGILVGSPSCVPSAPSVLGLELNPREGEREREREREGERKRELQPRLFINRRKQIHMGMLVGRPSCAASVPSVWHAGVGIQR